MDNSIWLVEIYTCSGMPAEAIGVYRSKELARAAAEKWIRTNDGVTTARFAIIERELDAPPTHALV